MARASRLVSVLLAATISVVGLVLLLWPSGSPTPTERRVPSATAERADPPPAEAPVVVEEPSARRRPDLAPTEATDPDDAGPEANSAGCAFRGVVLAARGPRWRPQSADDPRPVERATVSGGGEEALTDDEGRFELGPGDEGFLEVRVEKPGWEPLVERLPCAGQGREPRLFLAEADVVVRGLVLDDAGTAVAGTDVSVGMLPVPVDDEGRFEVEIADPGPTVRVSAGAPGYVTAWATPAIVDGEAEVELVLLPEAQLVGDVQRPSAAEGARLTVTVYDQAGRRRAATTTAEDRYALVAPSEEPLVVVARTAPAAGGGEAGEPDLVGVAGPVSVSRGETAEVDLALEPAREAGGALAVEGLASNLVVVRAEWEGVPLAESGLLFTADAKSWTLGGLPRVPLTLVVRGADGRVYERIEIGAGELEEIDIELP